MSSPSGTNREKEGEKKEYLYTKRFKPRTSFSFLVHFNLFLFPFFHFIINILGIKKSYRY